MHIKRAIHKYGKEHFRIELIEECDPKLLDEREIYWIAYYNSHYNGYNLTEGGNSNRDAIVNPLEERVDIEEFKEFIISNYPTAKEVSDKFNICHASVYNLIRRLEDDRLKLNPKNPRKSIADIRAKEICEKYNEGYNIQDLIVMFHANKKYISKSLRANGVKIQRGRKSLIEYNNSKSVQTPLSLEKG